MSCELSPMSWTSGRRRMIVSTSVMRISLLLWPTGRVVAAGRVMAGRPVRRRRPGAQATLYLARAMRLSSTPSPGFSGSAITPSLKAPALDSPAVRAHPLVPVAVRAAGPRLTADDGRSRALAARRGPRRFRAAAAAAGLALGAARRRALRARRRCAGVGATWRSSSSDTGPRAAHVRDPPRRDAAARDDGGDRDRDLRRLLHVQQSVAVAVPLPPSGRALVSRTVLKVLDRAAPRS